VVSAPGVQVPAVTVENPALPAVVLGAVQPAGAATVTFELAGNVAPTGAENVNVNVFPVEPATTVVGLTTIVPAPSAAVAAVTVTPLLTAAVSTGALVAVNV
jgi:hypothetical protein